MREIVLDTETTGLDFNNGDRIIEVGCVELANHIPTGNNLQFYCSTEKKVNEEALKISGLSNEFLSQFPSFSKQANKLLNFIKNDTLIIHNAQFDIGFINNELQLMGIKKIQNKFVDTIALARKKLNTRSASLDYLCRRFSIDLGARALHGALLDCQLLSGVYIELLGGRQISLDLAKTLDSDTITQTKNLKNDYKIHEVKITEKNKQEHKDFVADLKNALWHKVNY